MKSCPVCSATRIFASHRRGALERGLLTWLGVFPFRCGMCQTRFLRISWRDPRHGGPDTPSPGDRGRPPRWALSVGVTVVVPEPDGTTAVVQGTAENASLEGARLRLPRALPQGTRVSLSLGGSSSRSGSIRWNHPQGDAASVHGVKFDVPLPRRATLARPLKRLRRRQMLRRALMGLALLLLIALASSLLVSLIESLRTYVIPF